MKKVFMFLFVLVVSSHCLWGAEAKLFDPDLKQRIEKYVYGRDVEMPADIADTIEKALGDENLKGAMNAALQEFNQRPKKILGVVVQPSRSRQNYFRERMGGFNCRRDKAEFEGLLQGCEERLLGVQKELVDYEDLFKEVEAERNQFREQLTAVQKAHEICPNPGVWDQTQQALVDLRKQNEEQAAAARQSAATLIQERETWGQKEAGWNDERGGLQQRIRGFEEAPQEVPVAASNVWSTRQKKQLVAVGVGAAVVSSAATVAVLNVWSRNQNRGVTR